MSITQLEQPIMKQLASYIEIKDVISYCRAFPNELEETVKEDYQKGLITKDEFNRLLKTVEQTKKERKI